MNGSCPGERLVQVQLCHVGGGGDDTGRIAGKIRLMHHHHHHNVHRVALELRGDEVTQVYRGARDRYRHHDHICLHARKQGQWNETLCVWEGGDNALWRLGKDNADDSTASNITTTIDLDFDVVTFSQQYRTREFKLHNGEYSTARLQYFVQAVVEESTNDKGSIYRSEPCRVRLPRSAWHPQSSLLQQKQKYDQEVYLSIDRVHCHSEPLLCGLLGHVTRQSMELSFRYNNNNEATARMVWSPDINPVVRVKLHSSLVKDNDDESSRQFANDDNKHKYRLQGKLHQHIVWKAQNMAIPSQELDWTLEPALEWNSNNLESNDNISKSDGKLVLLDGKSMELPTDRRLMESYQGGLIQIQHSVLFALYQQPLPRGNADTSSLSWTLVGTTPSVPLRIVRRYDRVCPPLCDATLWKRIPCRACRTNNRFCDSCARYTNVYW